MSPYASRALELAYRRLGSLYEPIVRWGLLPLGGERRCRRLFADWMEVERGQRVLFLCCGTGASERELARRGVEVEAWGLDLALGQLVRAARELGPGARLVAGDASDAPLRSARFDRVVIAFALHEMTRPMRRDVLAEALRLCRPDGRVIAIEHARPEGRWSRLAQGLWWGFWIPGNPEVATSRDLARRGLAREMAEAGLEPVATHRTRPDWVEAVSARPA